MVVVAETVPVDKVVAVACRVVENGQDLELRIVSQGMELDQDQLHQDSAGRKGQIARQAVDNIEAVDIVPVDNVPVVDNNRPVAALLHIEDTSVSDQTAFLEAPEDFVLANRPFADCLSLPGPNPGCQFEEESIAMMQFGLLSLVAGVRLGLVVGLAAGPAWECRAEYGEFVLDLDLRDSAPFGIELKNQSYL